MGDIEDQVENPSVTVVLNQAFVFREQLRSINPEHHSQSACEARDLLRGLLDFAIEELIQLIDPDRPNRPIDRRGFPRLRSLAEFIRYIYTFLEHLRATSTEFAPPAIHVLFSSFIEAFFNQKKLVNAVLLVKPQWKYNFQFTSLNFDLEEKIEVGELDINLRMGAKTIAEFLRKIDPAIKKSKGNRQTRFYAIFSFAGLDTQDVLVYPLLAHEFGHFLDYHFSKKPLHLDPSITAITQAALQSFKEQEHAGQKEKTFANLLATTCVRELLADLIAVRLLGFAFFVSNAEFLKTLKTDSGIIERSGYPSMRFRLKVILEELFDDGGSFSEIKFFQNSDRPEGKLLEKYLRCWKVKLESVAGKSRTDEMAALENAVISTVPAIRALARRTVPAKMRASISASFFTRIEQLEKKLPPTCCPEPKNCIPEILAAAWGYQILIGEKREADLLRPKNKAAKTIATKNMWHEYREVMNLVAKAIEIAPIAMVGRSLKRPAHISEEIFLRNGVLSRQEIIARVQVPATHYAHLAIYPFRYKDVQSASYDVRLGHSFAVVKKGRASTDSLIRLKADSEYELPREELFIKSGSVFIIHPGDFVLATTLEFLALPSDLMASVEGKSSIGRRGLLVATAAPVAPKFRGVIVLELANAGVVPIELTPGIPIAQLVFQKMCSPSAYHGKHQGQIKA